MDFPGYFLIVHDIVDVLPGAAASLPGPGLGGQLGGLLRARHHRRRRGHVRAAVRAVPRPGARRGARHRRRHRVRPARGGHPVRLRASTAGSTPPRSPTSSPTGRRSAVRDMAKALGYSPGQQDAWCKQIDRWGAVRRRPTSTTSRTQVVELANELLTFPRHLGIHSGGMVICDRPVDRGLPGRVGPDGRTAPCCSGTRTTARRWGWSSSTCSAGHARPRCTTRFDYRSSSASVDLGTHAAGRRRGLRHALPGRLGRGVPGGEPGPDGHPAPAASRASSTTWWSRSR